MAALPARCSFSLELSNCIRAFSTWSPEDCNPKTWGSNTPHIWGHLQLIITFVPHSSGGLLELPSPIRNIATHNLTSAGVYVHWALRRRNTFECDISKMWHWFFRIGPMTTPYIYNLPNAGAVQLNILFKCMGCCRWNGIEWSRAMQKWEPIGWAENQETGWTHG